jgi:2-succinyl-5-enolpyruvyl-6-hydroxy-3-cyclohexene-1-carboxylate synthase
MNVTKSPNLNLLWSNLIVQELLRQGVDYFCISPGSRCGPLSIAVAQNPSAQSFIHFDERGTGFHALGYTAATRKPSVVITTSGTAVANLLPAVVEASKKKLPLIILTADRPPELRKTGANQTIDQPGIFSQYVKWQFDMPCPTKEISPEVVLTTIDQAVHQAKSNAPAPVHLNVMFREPLEPTKTEDNFTEYLKPIKSWLGSDKPYTTYVRSTKTLNAQELKNVSDAIENIKSGIIVVGKLHSAKEQEAVLKLSDKLYWPVFPDISSGLRLGNQHPNVIHSFDQILLSDAFMGKLKFDGVLHIGGRITSKRWYQFVEKLGPAQYITVLNHPLRNDPLHRVTSRVDTDVTEFCQKLGSNITQRKDNKYCFDLQSASQSLKEAIDSFMTDEEALSEPFVARAISRYIPKDSGLFLASSMPIREVDMYGLEHKNPVVIGANRGASGIDGTIATAVGFAKGLNQTTTLFIGDLALLHDMNSLAMVKSLKKPIVIVALNNDGGAIFSFLPIAEFKGVFESHFAAPHGLNFENAALMFGLDYVHPKTQKDFSTAYQAALKVKKSTLIEIKTERQANYQYHRKLQKNIMARLEKFK